MSLGRARTTSPALRNGIKLNPWCRDGAWSPRAGRRTTYPVGGAYIRLAPVSGSTSCSGLKTKPPRPSRSCSGQRVRRCARPEFGKNVVGYPLPVSAACAARSEISRSEPSTGRSLQENADRAVLVSVQMRSATSNSSWMDGSRPAAMQSTTGLAIRWFGFICCSLPGVSDRSVSPGRQLEDSVIEVTPITRRFAQHLGEHWGRRGISYCRIEEALISHLGPKHPGSR